MRVNESHQLMKLHFTIRIHSHSKKKRKWRKKERLNQQTNEALNRFRLVSTEDSIDRGICTFFF